MAAVKALAYLVHCPVKITGLQPLSFPITEALPDADSSKSSDQAAALQRLQKVSAACSTKTC